MFFREKHLFISSWFSSLSPLFFGEGKRMEILSIFNWKKRSFCYVFQFVFSWQEIHLFLFSFLLSFSCPFFSLGHGDHMADDKTRHQEKRVKPMVEMVTKVWKKKSFVGVFLSMTEGRSWWTRVNQGDCVRRLDILGKGSAIVCFLWLTDLSVTQTASGTPAGAGLSSCSQTSNVRRRSSTKRIKWSLSKIRSCARKNQKMWKSNSMNWKKKQANWQIDEHMSNYHERRVQQSLGEEFKERICQTRDATLAKFRSGTRFTERIWRRG